MKICPECAFANEERFPACLWCNALLVNVPSTPSPDPNHPEHAARRLARKRWSRQQRQQGLALGCYVAGIAALAAVPGLIFDGAILACFCAVAGVIGCTMIVGWLGQFPAMFLQGAASLALVLHFDLFNVLTGFMLLGHIIFPALFSQWVDLIDNGHA